MMQYNYNYGWMQQTGATAADNQVVVLREGQAPAFGHYDVLHKQLQTTPVPAQGAELAERALANALLPALLYKEQRYRLPE